MVWRKSVPGFSPVSEHLDSSFGRFHIEKTGIGRISQAVWVSIKDITRGCYVGIYGHLFEGIPEPQYIDILLEIASYLELYTKRLITELLYVETY